MIRAMQKADVDRSAGIWLDANRKAHHFIAALRKANGIFKGGAGIFPWNALFCRKHSLSGNIRKPGIFKRGGRRAGRGDTFRIQEKSYLPSTEVHRIDDSFYRLLRSDASGWRKPWA